jgi:Ser-tRNA(Ala) deacylase AlaX
MNFIQNDTGFLTIEGKEYTVVNAEKVGKSVLHILGEELSEDV